MSGAEIARYKDEAVAAMERGDLAGALAACVQLERLDPADASWPRWTAKIYRRAGQVKDEVAALDRAARIHEAAGDVIKAAAVSKQILELDPRHRTTLDRLSELRRRGVSTRPPAAPRPAAVAAAAWSDDPSAGIHGLALREVVPGASRVDARSSRGAGVYRIPLEDDASSALDLSLEEMDDTPADRPLHEMGRAPAPPPKPVGPAPEDSAVLAVEEELRAAQKADAALTETPLFSDLDERAFGELLVHARLQLLPKEQVLFRQGDLGRTLFVIASGSIGVIDEGPPRRGLSKLGDGDFFGENGLLMDQPRSATITALEDTELIAIDREVIQRLVERNPNVLTVLLRFFRDRSVDRLLATHPIFTSLSVRDRESLKRRFSFLEVEPGAALLEAGEVADGLLVLLAGRAEALSVKDGRETKIGVLSAGDMMGEISIIRQQPATGRVRAVDKCFAIELPAADFTKIVNARPEARAFVEKLMASRVEQTRAVLRGRGAFAGQRVAVF